MTPRGVWERVDRSGDGCWVFKGATRGPSGHGVLTVNCRRVGAHVHAWEQEFGPVPEGMCVCHYCNNPPCVRPSHLYVATQQQNTKDAFRDGLMGVHWQRRKTHCKHGHPFDARNTYVNAKGRRGCRACQANRERQKRRERRAA